MYKKKIKTYQKTAFKNRRYQKRREESNKERQDDKAQVNKKKPCDYLLSHLISSIIGTRELDFRVRDGNGYNLSVMVTWHNKQIRRKRNNKKKQ